MKKVIDTIINGGALPASEGEKAATEGVRPQAEPVTTSANPTNPRVLRNKPRTHLKQTRHNTPGAPPPIVTERTQKRRSPRLQDGVQAPQPTGKPNSARIPLHQPNTITQAAVDELTANVYYGANSACWTPNKYLQFDPANIGTDADTEHFCAPVVHPETEETITSYRKLAKDQVTKET